MQQVIEFYAMMFKGKAVHLS